MSMENAKEFLKKIVDDEALKERLAGKEPEEFLAAAKELGMECTWEELEAIAKSMELSPDEMGNVSAAYGPGSVGNAITSGCGIPKCTDPLGHFWAFTHYEEEEDTFCFIPIGTLKFIHYKCKFCNATKREPVRSLF